MTSVVKNPRSHINMPGFTSSESAVSSSSHTTTSAVLSSIFTITIPRKKLDFLVMHDIVENMLHSSAFFIFGFV